MNEDQVEPINLPEFSEVWETSVEVGDPRHLWDWLVYNGYVLVEKEA